MCGDDKQRIVENMAAAVPEVYFDLIARIIPGSIGLALVIVLTQPRGSLLVLAGMSWAPTAAASAFFLIIAYAVAMLLTPLGKLLVRLSRLRGWKRLARDNAKVIVQFNERMDRAFAFVEPNNPGKLFKGRVRLRDMDGFETKLHEYLKARDGHARRVLPKLSAEVDLVANIAAVLLVLLLVLVALAFAGTALGSPCAEAFALADLSLPSGAPGHITAVSPIVPVAGSLALALWATKYRDSRLRHRHYSLLAQHINAGE